MHDQIMLFAFGLLLLIKGGDWFVDGATAIAHRFHVPELLIGATVVSIGTTLPEVMVSATSALSGHGEIAYGNAIGSIICNTALIAAVTVAVRPAAAPRTALRVPVLFFFGSAAIYLVSAYALGEFPRWIGLVLLSVFLAYMALQVIAARRAPAVPSDEVPLPEADAHDGDDRTPSSPLLAALARLVLGAALIALGADLLVDNGTKIAEGLGVPESVIALTFVALGTSLPELVTAITSLTKGHGALSLGNVIGANIFNLVLVSGVSVTLSPFAVPAGTTLLGHPASLVLDIPVMLLVMALLTLPALCRGKLYRWQGIALLGVYAAFCTLQFVL
ncbi:MAG: calcium/sodium antiporter [Clostridia bacterium]|nr:calcium/sodium antiporter [Clostridia bacterium]